MYCVGVYKVQYLININLTLAVIKGVQTWKGRERVGLAYKRIETVFMRGKQFTQTIFQRVCDHNDARCLVGGVLVYHTNAPDWKGNEITSWNNDI